MDLSFKGRAKRLDDIDLPKLGHKLGVGEDEIHAFIDVETRGYGFDKLGRPLMLFEPHVFYRNLSGAKRDRAVKEGLAYKNWGAKPYPKDSYPRLRAAIAIDETAALKASSWGLGQVLGENYEDAGFLTVQDMVAAMLEDEELQLEASVNFILSKKLDDELRRHDWAGFARGYNGPGYARNKYDVKLAEAFTKWSRIKDTPWSPPIAGLSRSDTRTMTAFNPDGAVGHITTEPRPIEWNTAPPVPKSYAKNYAEALAAQQQAQRDMLAGKIVLTPSNSTPASLSPPAVTPAAPGWLSLILSLFSKGA